MSYRVKFDHFLSPPDLFDTADQAHEFFLNNNVAQDTSYTREEVRPAYLGDLITAIDLTSAMRENAQRLFRDDSLLDTPAYLKNQPSLLQTTQAAINAWGEMYGVIPDGVIVVAAVRVLVLSKA